MKLATKMILTLICAVSFIQCSQQQTKDIPLKTIVYGKIRNMDVYPTTKEFSVEIIDFRGKETIITDSIKKDGTFNLKFDLYIAQDLKIEPLVGRIFAHPGDSIHLEIDFKDIGEVKFTGDAQKPNQELYKYLNSNYSVNEFQNLSFKTFDFATCKHLCDSARNILVNKRIEFIKEVNPSAEIRTWTNQYIKAQYYHSLLQAPWRTMRHPKEYADNPQPKDYFNYLDSISSLFTNNQINTDAYELLNLYFFVNQFRILAEHSTLSLDNTMTDLIKRPKNVLLKQILIGNSFYSDFNQNNIEYFEKHRNVFDSIVNEPFIKLPLIAYYNKLKKDIQNPQFASDAILRKMDKTAGKDLMDSILAVNKEKVIYIDCWATWCAPCRAEMPSSRKLMEKYTGKNIEFVYLCLDSKEDMWKLSLAQLQLSGQNYFCNQEQSNAIRKGFRIDGIPFYVLINKQGFITDSGGYISPENLETIQKIDKLLNE